MKQILFILVIIFHGSFYTIGQKGVNFAQFDLALGEFDSDNALIVIGEAHEVAGTYELENHIIKKFVEQGYSTLIIECGISEAAILNDYIKTGNEEVLDYTRARGGNYRVLIEGIRSFSGEIKLKGVDFERGVCIEYLLGKWLHDIKSPKLVEFKNNLLSIKNNTSARKIKKLLLSAKEIYKENADLICDELGETRCITLGEILNNPVYQADFGVSSKTRDASILINLLDIPKAELENSILIFGSNHFTDKRHFGSKLAGDSRANDLNCIMILFAYENCKNYIRKKNYTSSEPLITWVNKDSSAESKIEFEAVTTTVFPTLNENEKFIVAKLINQ